MNTVNATHQGTTFNGFSSNSRHYEINASTILSTANQFKNVTNLNQDNVKLESLFQQFSIDIGRFGVKIKIIHTIRLITLLLFFLLSSLGSILISTTKLDSIVSDIFNIFMYIEIFLPESSNYYIFLLVNFVLLILYFSLLFFFLHLFMQYKHNLCISLQEAYVFVILTRIVVPIFTPYVSHLFTHSLYRLIFEENSGESAILVVISIPILISQISILFFSSSAYNATPVIRKHDTTQIWFSYSHYDWLFSVIIMILIFIQTFFLFLSEKVSAIIFTIVSVAISVCSALYIIIRLPFIYPRTNSIFFSTFVSSSFFSICPILAIFSPSSLPYYLVCLLIILIASFILGKYVINYRMISILKRFDQAKYQPNSITFSMNNDGLLNSFFQGNNENSNFASMNIKSDHDLSLLTRVGFLFNVPEINNSTFIHFGLEMTSKAVFVLSAIQVMLAIQTDNIILTPLYQASLNIGKGPFNMNSFRTLFNLMRQEMLTQFNKPLIEAISIVKKSNHFLEMTIYDFWTDVIKQKVDTLVHLLPRITEDMIKTELLYLRLARNYSLSPAVYREVVIFYYKMVGDYHKALHFQGMIDKAKAYQYNRPTYNHQQNNLALYSSFTSSSSQSDNSMTFLGNSDLNLNNLHEKLEPYIIAQDSIMSIPLPPLCWMYATMIVTIVLLLALPAAILGVSLYDVKKFHTSFSPIETVGDLDSIVARVPQLLRRRNLMEIDQIISPPPFEAGEPLAFHLEMLTEEAINESLINYHSKLVNGIDQLLKLCVPGATITKVCSEKIHESRVGDSVVMASVFDLLATFENSLSNILSDNNFDWKTASSSSSVLLIMQNFDALYSSLNSIINVLKNEINDFSKLTKIWLILIWVSPIVIILPLVLIMSSLFKKEVVFTLKLLFQIPKNEILNLKMTFKRKKREGRHNDDNQPAMLMASASQPLKETNENESENSKNDNGDDLTDSLATVPKQMSGLTGSFIFRLFVLVLFTCLMVTIGIVVFHESNFQLIDMSNAYASSINVYSSTFASYVWTQELFALKPLLFNESELKRKSFVYVNDFVSKFNNLLYGNSSIDDSGLKPALLLGDDIIDSYLKSDDDKFYTEDEVLYNPSYGIIHMVYITMSCECQMRLFALNSQWLFSENSQVSFHFDDLFVYHYEHVLFSHLNDYLHSAVQLFKSKSHALNDSKTDLLIMIFAIMFLIDILYYCTFLVSSFRTLLRHLNMPRHLLLLVSPEALLKSQSIVKWMTGMLDSSRHSHSTDIKKKLKNDIDVDFIVHYSKCSIVLASIELAIEKVNETFCNLFHVNEIDVIGMNFITFFKNSLINKDPNLFSWLNSEIHKMLEGNSTSYKCQFKSTILSQDSKLLQLSIIIEGIQDYAVDSIDSSSPAKAFSIVIVDETIQIQLEKKIELEKEKVESLYDRHFYNQVHKKLNENNSDISFEVSESTVMIASIDNWDSLLSSSNSPIEIMNFLNTLYSSYDDEIKKFPTLMKIRSITDTYLICSDLFTDPTISDSYIVINFALKILSISKKLSEDNRIGKIKFYIKIGINSGGPVICGVLGRIKPSFEIVGDVVNIASQLNRYCLPGFIQISDSTYNNVKYLNYNLKERGEIYFNNVKIMTYLISDIPFSNADTLFPLNLAQNFLRY